MGNIQSLNRNGFQNGSTFADMDVLAYDYQTNTNKLVMVTDAGNKVHGFKESITSGNDYRYDLNGNMVMDKNKGIGTDAINGITYNHLNLPVTINVNNGPDEGTIAYVYDATGVKLKKIAAGSSSGITEYAGNYIYEGTSTDMELKFFSHPEGYVEPLANGGYDYIYQYKDHLGNVRLSYKNLGSASNIDLEIQEENNYYPFGLKHKGYNSVVSSTNLALKRKFGGKEYQDELGLGWYDVTARNYDPALGRWMNLDPLAEQMRRHSPYNFGFNNPIYFQDYDGLSPQGPCGDKPCPDEDDEMPPDAKRAKDYADGLLDDFIALTLDLADDIKSIFSENAGSAETASDWIQSGAAIVDDKSPSKNAKALKKNTGVAGDIIIATDLIVEFKENGPSEDFVETAASEAASKLAGPAEPLASIVIENGKETDGVTNTMNMANNFDQSRRQMNAARYRNFTMSRGNSSTTQRSPERMARDSARARSVRKTDSLFNASPLGRFLNLPRKLLQSQ